MRNKQESFEINGNLKKSTRIIWNRYKSQEAARNHRGGASWRSDLGRWLLQGLHVQSGARLCASGHSSTAPAYCSLGVCVCLLGTFFSKEIRRRKWTKTWAAHDPRMTSRMTLVAGGSLVATWSPECGLPIPKESFWIRGNVKIVRNHKKSKEAFGNHNKIMRNHK